MPPTPASGEIGLRDQSDSGPVMTLVEWVKTDAFATGACEAPPELVREQKRVC